MDFKDYLIEEEKKVDKVAICFIKDANENEVYTVLASKEKASGIVADHKRYSFIAGSEGVKLVNAKGFTPMLFDLGALKKHVDKETAEAQKAAAKAEKAEAPAPKEDKK